MPSSDDSNSSPGSNSSSHSRSSSSSSSETDTDCKKQRKRTSAAKTSSVKMDPPAKVPRVEAAGLKQTQQPKGNERILVANKEKQTTSPVRVLSASTKKTQLPPNQSTPSARPVMQFGSFTGTADGGLPDPLPTGLQSVLLHGGISPGGLRLVHRLWPKWKLFTSFAPSMGYMVVEKRHLILLEDVEKIYLPDEEKPIWEVIKEHEAKYRNIRPEYVPPAVNPLGMSDLTRETIAQLYPDISSFRFIADSLGYCVIEKRRHILLEDIYLAYKNWQQGKTIQESVGIWEENYNSVRRKLGFPSLPPVVSQPTVVVPLAPASSQSNNGEFVTSSKDKN